MCIANVTYLKILFFIELSQKTANYHLEKCVFDAMFENVLHAINMSKAARDNVLKLSCLNHNWRPNQTV